MYCLAISYKGKSTGYKLQVEDCPKSYKVIDDKGLDIRFIRKSALNTVNQIDFRIFALDLENIKATVRNYYNPRLEHHKKRLRNQTEKTVIEYEKVIIKRIEQLMKNCFTAIDEMKE